MDEIVTKLREFCSEKNQKAVDSIVEYIDADEIETFRNRVALKSSITDFIFNREIILKDVNYLYGNPDCCDSDFIVLQFHGIERSFKTVKKVSILKVYEKRCKVHDRVSA